MKKFFSCVLTATLFFVAVSFGACANVELNRERRVNSVNHRGYFEAPENTLSAFRLSAEKGFKMVETDVSFTKDNVAVLLHDGTIDRTSNGRGNISELTYGEVLEFDFGSWKNSKYNGERIPTFEEFILLCEELSLHPYVEIKSGATDDQVASLVGIVQSEGISVSWISRNAAYLTQLYALRKDTAAGAEDRYGLIVDFVSKNTVDELSSIEKSKSFIDCNYLFLTKYQVNYCRENGIALEVWTLDAENQIANIDPYISGVTSNRVNAEDLFKTL